jgi:diacylglycerol O-acyltransferase / wax synthase
LTDIRMDRRMSDAEALMWTIEKDPALRSVFVQITFLDAAPDFDRFRARMERAVVVLPRLGQRVVAPPLGRFSPPEWADDPTFDIDFHVRHLGLPSPGTDRQLLDLAARLYEDPFDWARPLWNLTIVEGLTGGRAALLAKMHHTITDGVGGVRLSMQFIDLARDAPDPEPAAEAEPAGRDRGLAGVAIDAAGHAVRRQLGIARRAATVATRPQRLPALAADAVETARSLVRQAAITDPARSPLWGGRRSTRRRFETLTVSLDRVKRSAKGLGGTVNDLFVTAVAGGAGAYHRAHGAEVDELRMAMPVNQRDDRSAGGNAFSPSRVLVPVGPDPVARFETVRQRLAVTKGERALALAEGLAGLLNTLPTALLVRVARQQAETVDFATSNLRGAGFDLFVAGAEIVANHPMGPTAGTAFNATVMSYRDGFDVGLNVDVAAVDDPGLLREAILDSFEELLAL